MLDSKRIDIGVGIFLCILSLAIYIYANQYEGSGVNKYGPNFFPQSLSILLFLSSLLMIVEAFRGNALKNVEKINKIGFVRTSITLGIAIAYLVAMQYLGFFLATVLFLYALMMHLKQEGQLIRIIVSILVTIAIFGIFSYLLNIPLPEGVFYRG